VAFGIERAESGSSRWLEMGGLDKAERGPERDLAYYWYVLTLSPIIQHSQFVLTVIPVWIDDKSLEAYKTGVLWAKHLSALSSLSAPGLRPEVQRFYFRNAFYFGSTPFTGIIDVFLPAISPEQREFLENIRGLRAFNVPFNEKDQYYTKRNTRGWSTEKQNSFGEPVIVLRFLNYWKSAEKEEEFKTTAGVVRKGKVMGLWNLFKEELSTCGMKGMIERHVSFQEVPKCLDADVEDESEEGEVEALPWGFKGVE
jgi:hypothetical protein